jgi:hypothetical protein
MTLEIEYGVLANGYNDQRLKSTLTLAQLPWFMRAKGTKSLE